MRPSSDAGDIIIRHFDPARDSLDALTTLLHDAYRPLAARGFNFVATTQDVSVTRKRVESATMCWVAEGASGRIAGTISYYAGEHFTNGPAWYARRDVCHFGQYAVSPALQRGGIGSALLRAVERQAIADQKAELSCDTAEPATHLLEFYGKLGFRVVGRHRWPHARYESVVLSKPL